MDKNNHFILESIKCVKEERSECEKETEEQFYNYIKYDFMLTKSYL